MVSIQSLDLLKLVSIPVLDHLVLTGTEEVVAVAVLVVWNESDLENGVLVSEKCFVAITEIQTPKADILIGRTGDNELAVEGDIHVENRQLVSVEVEEELQGIDEEDLHCVVEKGDSQKARIWRESQAENIICNFKGSGVDQLQPWCGTLCTWDILLDDLEIPELCRLISTSGNHGPSIWVDL